MSYIYIYISNMNSSKSQIIYQIGAWSCAPVQSNLEMEIRRGEPQGFQFYGSLPAAPRWILFHFLHSTHAHMLGSVDHPVPPPVSSRDLIQTPT